MEKNKSAMQQMIYKLEFFTNGIKKEARILNIKGKKKEVDALKAMIVAAESFTEYATELLEVEQKAFEDARSDAFTAGYHYGLFIEESQFVIDENEVMDKDEYLNQFKK